MEPIKPITVSQPKPVYLGITNLIHTLVHQLEFRAKYEATKEKKKIHCLKKRVNKNLFSLSFFYEQLYLEWTWDDIAMNNIFQSHFLHIAKQIYCTPVNQLRNHPLRFYYIVLLRPYTT